jgi:hypothetical protein
MAERVTLNYDQAKEWYGGAVAQMADASAQAQAQEVYYILTTSEIVNNSAKLQDFVDHKTSLGFNVTVVTESAWGSLTGDAAANAIRQYLQENYLSQNIKYILLIGNPHPQTGDLPMKMLWPRSYADRDRQAPSDYFYADLTGNWDLDNDGLYGEWGDDFGTGGVDIDVDIIVGRIPFYGVISDLDSILQKIIDYETGVTGGAWIRKFLFSMKPLDSYTPGYQLGEAIKNDVAVPSGFTSTRVYDQNYGLNPPPEMTPCTTSNVLAAWQQYAGFHFWSTHGSHTSASNIFNSSMCPQLDDAYPSFTFQGSCHNAYPEYSNNLGYSLLKNGAIGTVSATRVSWYLIGQTTFTNTSSIGGIGYRYAMDLAGQRMPCGEALYTVFTEIPFSLWMNFCVFNLYGDPSVSYYVDLNDPTPPTIPVVTDGGDITYISDSLSASWTATDPDSGIAEYQYEITEGSTGGAAVRDWTSTGLQNSVTAEGLDLFGGRSYYFGVQAKNPAGLWSDIGYSDGITYEIDTTPPTTPVITELDYKIGGDMEGSNGGSRGGVTVIASWTSTDPESGIAEYQYRITENGQDGPIIMDWTSTGDYPSFYTPGLDLIDQTTYFVGVKAKNISGVWSDIGYRSFTYSIQRYIDQVNAFAQLLAQTLDFNIDGRIDWWDMYEVERCYGMAFMFLEHLPQETFDILNQNGDTLVDAQDRDIVTEMINIAMNRIEEIQTFAHMIGMGLFDVNNSGQIDPDDIVYTEDIFILVLQYEEYLPDEAFNILDQNDNLDIDKADKQIIIDKINDAINREPTLSIELNSATWDPEPIPFDGMASNKSAIDLQAAHTVTSRSSIDIDVQIGYVSWQGYEPGFNGPGENIFAIKLYEDGYIGGAYLPGPDPATAEPRMVTLVQKLTPDASKQIPLGLFAPTKGDPDTGLTTVLGIRAYPSIIDEDGSGN